MSPQRSSPWPAGAPAWVDVATPDMDAAQTFYGGLFGWTFGARSEEFGGYCMCEVDGVPAAGMAPARDGVPPSWTLYFGSDDVAASAVAIPAAGGMLLTDVLRIGDSGAMVVAADPAGAVFGLWEAEQMIGIGVFNQTGALFWEDLRSSDHEASRAFYGAVLGWEFRPMPMASPDYTTFHHPGDDAPLGGLGGMMGMTGFPSHWIAYFGVDDVDVGVQFVETHGGHVISPGFDTPFGRMAAVTDPFGAILWIMSPSAERREPDRSE